MAALTAGELTLLRGGGHTAKFYLSVSQPRSLLAGQINGSFTRGDMAIDYDNGLGSGFSDIEENQVMRLVTSLNIETVRVKSISGSQTSGTVTVAGNSILWEDNANFEILEDYPLKPKPPRFTASTFYKDWTETYTDQNFKPKPVVIAGPHRAKFLSGGQAVFNVDLTDSYAVAKGATIANYGVSVTPAAGVTISVTAGVGTITVTQAGQYWVEYSATDTSGKTQITKRRLWVHETDPADADYPYTDLEITTLQGDWERGGWALEITVNGVADTTAFPDEALVCLWYTVDYNGTQQYIGQPDGVLFCGYIRKGTIRANWDDGTVSFEAETIQAVLRNISMRSIPLHAVRNPGKWYEYPTWLTNGRALRHYWGEHSMLFEVADVYGLADDATIYRAGVTFQKGDLYSQAENVIRENGICAHAVCNKAGQLYLVRDIQLLDDTARAAKTVTAEITKVDRHDNINLVDRYPYTAGMSYVEGIYFDGESAAGICAKAPGHVPEDQGSGEISKRQQTLTGEAHAKSVAGRLLAVANNPYPEVRIDFDGIWAGVLDIIGDEWWKIDVDATDTSRGLSWTDKKLVCRTVNSRTDPVNGFIATNAVLEPEASGPEGIIVTCIGLPEPPGQPRPRGEEPGLEALIAFSSASYRDDNAGDWTELQTADFNGGAIDPWWRIKTGSNNPIDVIWWAAATGALYRFVGRNGLPDDRRPVSDPPNTWSDDPAPAGSDLEFLGPFPDRWVKNIWYTLARWQNGSDAWRGWLVYTDDDGLTWTWVELYDGVDLPDQIKPLWLAVNGSLVLVTIWEDDTADTLRLLYFDTAITYDSEEALGAATLAEVDNRDCFAFPVTVLDDDDRFYVAGRMNAPAGLAGTQHVIISDDAGATFSSFENGWSTDHCGALSVGLASGGSRPFYAVRQPPVVSTPDPPASSTWTYEPSTYLDYPATDGVYGYSRNPDWGDPLSVYRYDPSGPTRSVIGTFGNNVDEVVVFKGEVYCAVGNAGSGEVEIYRYTGSGTSWDLVHSFSVASTLIVRLYSNANHIICLVGTTGTGAYHEGVYSNDGNSWSAIGFVDMGTEGLQPYGASSALFQGSRSGSRSDDLALAVGFRNNSTSTLYIAVWSAPNFVAVYSSDDYDIQDNQFYWRDVGSQNYRSTNLTGWTATTGSGVTPIQGVNLPWAIGISISGSIDYYLHFWDEGAGDWAAGELIIGSASARTFTIAMADDNGDMWLHYTSGAGSGWYKRDNPVF